MLVDDAQTGQTYHYNTAIRRLDPRTMHALRGSHNLYICPSAAYSVIHEYEYALDGQADQHNSL